MSKTLFSWERNPIPEHTRGSKADKRAAKRAQKRRNPNNAGNNEIDWDMAVGFPQDDEQKIPA